MNSLRPFNTRLETRFLLNPSSLGNYTQTQKTCLQRAQRKKAARRIEVKCSGGDQNKSERRTFLTLEEAGLVEISGLSTHERFLCRLTVTLFSFHLFQHSYEFHLYSLFNF